MNKNCLKCPASLACLTDMEDMRIIDNPRSVMVIIPHPITGTSDEKDICTAPEDCPHVEVTRDHVYIMKGANSTLARARYRTYINWRR